MGRSETRRSGNRHAGGPLEVGTRYMSHVSGCPHRTVSTTEVIPDDQWVSLSTPGLLWTQDGEATEQGWKPRAGPMTWAPCCG